MTDLMFWTALSGLWIAIAWLPYILDRIVVRGLWGALDNPRPDAAPQSPWAQRAMRAHTVAVEAFVAFGPLAMLAAMTRPPEDHYPDVLAMTFFIGIFAHYWIYVLGIPVIRTLAFALAALSTAALGLRVLGAI